MQRLVIVGASLAGLHAAQAARAAGFDGSVTMIGAERHPPYDRLPLSKTLLVADTAMELPVFAEFGKLGVEPMFGAPATGLDVVTRNVSVGGSDVPYDALVIATGSTPATPWPDVTELGGVHPLRTWEDAVVVRAALDDCARVVIVGAGFIGGEVATAARARGLDVTIVELAQVPLERALGACIGAHWSGAHERAGATLRCGVGVSGFASVDGRLTGVELDDGSLLPADLAVLGVGAVPATDWLRNSGLTLHQDGGIICDQTLSAAPGVYAAGDVAWVPSSLAASGWSRTQHWINAAEQGALAGGNAVRPAAVAAQKLTSIPYFWTDWYGERLQFVGVLADDVRVIRPAAEGLIAVYLRGDRVVGAVAIEGRRHIMKLRRMILAGTELADVQALVVA